MTASTLPPAPPATARVPLWRRGVLGNPGYPRYVIAMMQGATGWWISRIAQDWLLLELTGDLTAMGLATSLQFLPLLVFGLYGGVLADKFNVRTLLVLSQVGMVAVSATLAVLAISGTILPWHIFVAAGLTGMMQVIEQPARASTIAQLAGPHIGQALSLNSIAFQLAGFWGPGLSAAVVASLGPGWAFAANGLGCAITIALLWRIPTKDPEPTAARTVSLRRGLASMRDTTEIGWTMVLAAILALLALNMPLIYADMANRQFGTGVEGYSLFNSVGAVGCIVGALVSARVSTKPRLRWLTALLAALAVILLAASMSPGWMVFAAMVAALSAVSLTFQLLSNALVQLAVDPEARGRVMGLYTLIVFGGMSLAGPLVGAVVQRIGGRDTLVIIGGLLLIMTMVTAMLIARFAGQRLTLSRQGVTISEPAVPRHVRLAEHALSDAERARARAEESLQRAERFQAETD
ncbi:MFS transporter [Aestuariimicrobium ganziense]|uniref:MFS transporter n=1 Tax=Aestuariimicrobium ganziense TaxID=2773677 RepID=UPI0019457D3F|nr:MFS transporter [Aestuariimicrobium ganziense]